MAENLATNTRQGLLKQRQIWENKRVIRLHYIDWYKRAIRWFPEGKEVYEIGCGSGNFKSYYQDIISTDVFKQPWVDRVLKADSISEEFPKGSVDGFLLIDVLHHIPDPLGFLRDASQALKKGGRIIMIEPYISQISGKVIYGYLHHEPVDFKDDLLGKRPDFAIEDEFANAAIPTMLVKDHKQFATKIGHLELVKTDYFAGILYSLSGGFNYPNLLPLYLHRLFLPVENIITEKMPKLFALRVLVVLEKK